MISGIELHDWKAFRKLRLDFSEGINFITGPNGIGKSSILQAICLAFTGRTRSLTEISDLRDLIHKGANFTQVKVKFRCKNQNMYIKRRISFRGRERCTILDSQEKIVFEGKWDDTTKYIEELFNIKAMFFESILYMSEGDVYRIIHEPPGRVLLDEIDEALGVKRLRNLRDDLEDLVQEFGDKEREVRNSLRQAELARENRQDLGDMSLGLNRMLEQRKKSLLDYENIETKLWRFKDQLRTKERLIADLKFLDSQKAELDDERDQIQAIRNRLAKITEELEDVKRERIEADTKLSNLEKILDLVEYVKKSVTAKIECPVCGKPIAKHEVETIEDKTRKKMIKLRQNINKFVNQIDELGTIKSEVQSRVDAFRDKETRLKALQEQIPKEVEDIHRLEQSIAQLDERVRILERRKDGMTEQMKRMDVEIGELRERIAALRAVVRMDVARIRSDLESTSKGRYLSQFASIGVEEFIRRQRDSELGEQLYKYVSHVWNSFKKEDGWNVRLDEYGIPRLHIKSDTYPFSSLSGGEKTALLVVTRTALSRLIAREVGFLLLDEPLEHLDSRNRRSLLRFLKDAYVERIVGQLIVTTVEESLLNRFMGFDFVNIIPLESIRLSPLA